MSGTLCAVLAAISVFRIGGHSHTCRGTDFKQDEIEARLHEWAARNEVDAMGLGSPWTAENAKTARYFEHDWRDRYYAGDLDGAKRAFDPAEVEAMIARVNAAPGNGTLYYVDNETPKQRYGHLWHVGFKTKVDHMKNPKVRELMDYLAKGLFRKDYYKGCTPGIVPVSAWRMDEMAAALKGE